MENTSRELSPITQNVDGTHRIAGNQNIIELHGNIDRNKRFDEDVIIENWEDTGEIPLAVLSVEDIYVPM
jgi:NAD-dependent SIR2 family protein deacetylase